MTTLKSLFFLVLVPGMLIGYFPYLISTSDNELFAPGMLGYLAFPPWLTGGASMLWCFWNFLVNGRGTPAPIDPPKELVAVGLYRFVRNPMYVAGIITLFGWMLWSPSLPLIVAPFVFFTAAHLFVTLYEEPTLKKKFGAPYGEYIKRVPRWIPKVKQSYIPNNLSTEGFINMDFAGEIAALATSFFFAFTSLMFASPGRKVGSCAGS